jgi:hypothetical protein
MAGSAKATIDHDEIRRWVEERGGCPAHVKRTGAAGDPGVLRIDFPGFSGKKSLERISWDQFFDWFEENDLAFLHQDEKGGKVSRFSKLVSRDSVDVQAPAGETREAEPQAQRAPSRAAGDRQMDAIELIEHQHDVVRELFGRLERDEDVVDELLQTIALHLALEERVVYPQLLDSELAERTYENITEHIGVKRLLADIIEGASSDATIREAQLRVLRRLVDEHMDEEEEQMLPAMARLYSDDERVALAQEMAAFTAELLADDEGAALETVLSSAEVPAMM